MWQKDDDEHYGESPGGEEPDDGELSLDGGVVSDNSKHMKPLNRHSKHGEEASDNSNHEEAIEKLEMVTTLKKKNINLSEKKFKDSYERVQIKEGADLIKNKSVFTGNDQNTTERLY